MTEAERIAKGLTEAQAEAVIAMTRYPTCSYQLRLSLSILNALHRRKIVEKRARVGSMWSPRTAIDWRLNEIGLSVREVLLRDTGHE